MFILSPLRVSAFLHSHDPKRRFAATLWCNAARSVQLRWLAINDGWVSPPSNKISLRQEQLSELLKKLAVAREVARGIFPLHLAE